MEYFCLKRANYKKVNFIKSNLEPMDLHLPIHDSSLLFDSKPFENKLQKAETQRIIRKNLSLAFSRCISSYMLSQVQDPQEISFAKHKTKTKREGIIKSPSSQQTKKQKMKKIMEAKKHQIHKKIKDLSGIVTEKLCKIAQMVIDLPESFSTEYFKESTQNSQKYEMKTSINESNKNFLIELLLETKLLKFYKGMDRSFPKLVEEAQKTYYEVKSSINTKKSCQKTPNEKQLKKNCSEKLKNYQQFYKTSNDIHSMKRRHNEAVQKFQTHFEVNNDECHVRGYESSENESQNRILEEDYMILTNTNHTRNENALDENEKCFPFSNYFIQNTSRYSKEDPQDQPQKSFLQEYLTTTNQDLEKMVRKMMISEGEKKFEIKNKIHVEHQNSPRKLIFG